MIKITFEDGTAKIFNAANNELKRAKKAYPSAVSYEEIECCEYELTSQENINEIEKSQTARMLRQATLGDEDSIALLQSIEDKIATLRD